MPGEGRSGLDRLLRPRSIAVIGGGSWCANVIEQCRKIGFEGAIWPVHPLRDVVGGLPAVRRIEDLPEAPDAAFIGINREGSIEALGVLSARGAGGAVCFASGFSEAQAETGDGQAMQAALLEAAGAMTVLGPNCYGVLNYLDGAALWPDQHGGARVARGVALVTQSSNIAINLTMQDRGLPLAYVVTVGNQAQTGMSEVARALLRDARVTALGLHIEGIDDLRGFEALAEDARALGKPIVALKIGRSEQARAATVSHTASLAGSDAGARALLARLGIGQASSLAAMLEALKLLHVAGPLASRRIASMSCSGGEASLVADTAFGRRLELPALDAGQQTALRAVLGPRVALANPLDYHTYIWGDEEALAGTFGAMMQGDLALGCVILDFPRADRCDATAWEPVIAAVARAKAASGRAMAIVGTLKETLPEAVSKRLDEMGIVPLAGLAEAVEAMEIAADLGEVREVAPPLVLAPPATGGRVLSEAEAKAALAGEGVRVPVAARAATPQEAVAAAARIGFPVVLKGEGIAHKSEAGAVALNLGNAEAVAAAARAMPADSFLVEEMISGPVAELLVGVVADPAHGYVLTLAAGGVLTEVLGDSVSVLVPTSRAGVRAALGALKIAPVLAGYRGARGADMEAIVDAVMAVQAYVAAQRPLEIEINPLMCGPGGAVAADALIRIGETT
ncbi:acetate--CoA ligase family protein [Rhodalgimonas zhirmunskyi]|uniref:Acetate--CoA ligase family protein n=1 Tax=Rhodalgimonas zhirmunskyi TaxID=2964767 RepID=A0AAJ1X7R0_9RHOB|nr:acetate--CoA ligase family protein [Rhodoalgimonas zhirmunskyi]MDQ2094822.1 acetate--CoA ligase family protein [Rhodoalgimonas zhirmunskyi]